ncbi:hypothetical protein [Marinobacter phage PS3]|nr:hypothetical protein [Marinobacter phage PS3]
MNQTLLDFGESIPQPPIEDPEPAFKCAGSEAILVLRSGPLMFAGLVKEVLGSESFRHRKAWVGILTFSWLLDRLQREGRLISVRYYYGARSPEEGEYKGYTHIYALPGHEKAAHQMAGGSIQ